MKIKSIAVLTFACLMFWASVALVSTTGCKNTSAQRIAYNATDAIGKSVDRAMNSYADYAFEKARVATGLGTNATQAVVLARVRQDTDWQKVQAAHAKFDIAYRLWCAGNAVAWSGTNAVSIDVAVLRSQAITAATELTTLIAIFLPSTPIIR